MGGRKDLITAGLTLGALADAAAKAKGKMSAIIATESGAVVSFTAADAAPVVDLTAAIVPVQSGSGDPSPTNIRPISGWTECNVYRSGAGTSDPTIYTVTFGSAGTVYGGMLDVTTGTLTVDKAKIHVVASDFVSWLPNLRQSYTGVIATDAKVDLDVANYICDMFKPVAVNNRSGNIGNYACFLTNPNRVACSSPAESLEDFKSLIPNGIDIVYELATPIVYDLTPVEIRTLAGQNNIWADTGSVTVSYTADTKAFIDNYIAARRNG